MKEVVSNSSFALRLIQLLKKSVAIICTSGTNMCNYASVVPETFYQDLMLIILIVIKISII